MKVIITGAGGLVGACLARRFGREHEVLAPRRAELDVTDAAAVRRFIDGERPRFVVNCAVLGVDECERDQEGERAAFEANPRSYVVRTSWVFGAGKESFLSTAHRELSAGRRVRAISDTWASVTYVEDLAARVEELVGAGRHGLYHAVNDGVCTYEDFAREAARLAGLDEEEAGRLVETVTEAEVRRPARRPHYTPLRCTAAAELGLPPLRHWREALAA